MTVALKHILLVEDDPDIQTVARLALEAVGGFRVTVCGSGTEAIKAVLERTPDLILMDAIMPSMDGPSTILALRQIPQTARTPVIFLTANSQTMDLSLYRKLGALDVMRKPFDPMTLSDEIRNIWERANA